MNVGFLMNSIALGVGLAMDAFSVSLCNGLGEPKMKQGRMVRMAFVYAFFQFLMPMIGWFCVHTIVKIFTRLTIYLPWIAFFLLVYLGAKMIYEARTSCDVEEIKYVDYKTLLMQGIATSIDALSVGFAIASYDVGMAFVASLIIALVTFILCKWGIQIGKQFGTKYHRHASRIGGCILIFIGIKILIEGVFLK